MNKTDSRTNKTKKEQPNRRRVIILIIAFLLLALCLISILIWQGLIKPDMSKTQESPVLKQVIGNYTPGEDLYLISGGKDISVLVPGCAINQKGKIVVTPLGKYLTDQVKTEAVWSRPKTVDVSFYSNSNELIEDLPISCSIRVCFVLTTEEWDLYVKQPSNFDIQFLNDTNPNATEWISLQTVTLNVSHELCGDYNELGLYALATKIPLIPLSGPDGPYDFSLPTTTPTEPGLYEPPSD
jgi:hypothetical protein